YYNISHTKKQRRTQNHHKNTASVQPVEKAVPAGGVAPAQDFTGVYIFYGIEQVCLDLWVFGCKRGDQLLHLSPLGISSPRMRRAGTWQESQPALPDPACYVALTHMIERPNEFHPIIVGASQPRQHCLDLP